VTVKIATHRHVDLEERRARLGVRHLLAPGLAAADAPDVIRALGGAWHATDPATPQIGVSLRLAEPGRAALDRTLLEDRTAVRHHAMRRTVWILDLDLAPAAHQACTMDLARKEWVKLEKSLAANGIDDPASWLDGARQRALEVIAARGSCTARELGADAPDLAIPLVIAAGTTYQGTQGAHTQVVQNLGFDGEIVRTESTGSWVGGEFRWAISKDWIPNGFTVLATTAARDTANSIGIGIDTGTGTGIDVARARLAVAYLRAFGPATAVDLQWWAGWTVGATRRALETVGAVPVSVDGEPDPGPAVAWLLPDDLDRVEAPTTWATVLPSLDPTVMGWKQRHWYCGEHGRFGHTVFDRNGNAGNSIVADGAVVGTWAHRPDGAVVVEYLEATTVRQRSLVDESVDRYLATTGDTVVRPRYPAPLQRSLLER
jgi:hypothetical protein